MYLTDEAGKPIEFPSSADIERVINDLDDGAFAILESESGSYMQTLRTGDVYELEYQIGDVDQHYRAKNPVSRDQVIKAMSQYVVKDDRWEKEVDWEPQDLSADAAGKGCASVLLFALVLGVVAGSLL